MAERTGGAAGDGRRSAPASPQRLRGFLREGTGAAPAGAGPDGVVLLLLGIFRFRHRNGRAPERENHGGGSPRAFRAGEPDPAG